VLRLNISEKIYIKNMEILETISPNLAKRIEDTTINNIKYEVLASKSNVPTIRVKLDDGTIKFLHSSYDPWKEASIIIENIDIRKSPNFLCLGFGLGYHIHKLIDKLEDNNQVFVIEKDIQLFKLALMTTDISKILRFPGLRLFIGQSLEEIRCNLALFQSNFLLYDFNDLLMKSFDIKYYQEISKIIRDIIKNAEVNLTTYITSVKRFYKNIFDNSAEILFGYGVYSLKDRFLNIPAILISAGPSLEKNIKLLKKIRKRAIFIAVATSLKPLLINNVFPDFVVALDYNPISVKAFCDIEDMKNISLLFDPKVPHSIFQHFTGRKFVYQAPHFLLNWFSRISEDKGVLERALTVSHLAFFLARHMGCSPIIFTGQDLVFTSECTHAKNTFYMDEYFDEISKSKPLSMVNKTKKIGVEEGYWRKTEDIFGNNIDILQNMYTYLQFFENEIANTSSKCIDATEGGAAIKGTDVMPLKEAVYQYCEKPIKQDVLEKSYNIHLNFDKDMIMKGFVTKKNEFRYLEKYCLNIKKGLNKRNGNQKKFCEKVERLMQIINYQRENCKILEELNEKEVISRIKTNQLLSSENFAENDIQIRKKKFDRDMKYLGSILEGTRFLQRLLDIGIEKLKTYKETKTGIALS